jgi:hypothetical protein
MSTTPISAGTSIFGSVRINLIDTSKIKYLTGGQPVYPGSTGTMIAYDNQPAQFGAIRVAYDVQPPTSPVGYQVRVIATASGRGRGGVGGDQ